MMNVMKEFNKEMEKAGIQSDMILDGMEMMEDPNVDAEGNDVYSGILGEIGLEYIKDQPAVAVKPINPVVEEEEKVDNSNDELERRLAALRGI